MAKINLSDLVGELKGRGRAPYENPALEAEIKELDPAIDGDAFVCELAQGNPDDEDYTNHKAMWRGRAEKIAENTYSSSLCQLRLLKVQDLFLRLKYINSSILLQRINFYSYITIIYITNDQFFWCLAI